jgi:hypothetical protein
MLHSASKKVPWGIEVASVELRCLTKRFASLAVVDDVSLVTDHGKLVNCSARPAAARQRPCG